MGTTVTVVADGDDEASARALGATQRVVETIDSVCSRFKETSELSMLNHRAGQGPVVVSAVLWSAIGVGLDAAEATGGLVDPTVGGCLEEIGYTVTFRDVAGEGPPLDPVRVCRPAGWKAVIRDVHAKTIELPPGVHLDLGATGKAWAADLAASAAALDAGCGVLVNCGGDIACAGTPPQDGWDVRVAAAADAPEFDDIRVFDGGIATSSPQVRQWRRGDRLLHHIIDPATGLPVDSPWTMASVVAATCSGANAAATAAILMGRRALDWFNDTGIPARLVARDGAVHCSAKWPPRAQAP